MVCALIFQKWVITICQLCLSVNMMKSVTLFSNIMLGTDNPTFPRQSFLRPMPIRPSWHILREKKK